MGTVRGGRDIPNRPPGLEVLLLSQSRQNFFHPEKSGVKEQEEALGVQDPSSFQVYVFHGLLLTVTQTEASQ